MKKIYLFFILSCFCCLAPGAFAQVSTYSYTGTIQTFNVPVGVTLVSIDAIGGAGGGPYQSSGVAGPVAKGGRVQCNMTVTGGTTLYVTVGGKGSSYNAGTAAGFNGGNNGGGTYCGTGGGASDIRLVSGSISGTQVQPYTLTNRLVVAGGGGGGGDESAPGGLGGGTTGGTGGIWIFSYLSTGGTQSSGGTCSGSSAYNGTIGVGGPAFGSSGGGGGGYFGGAGGYEYNGAGGGSSYTDPTTCTSVINTQGYSGATGNGQVTITILCNNPGTISGNTPICMGSTNTLSIVGAAGGTWSSGSPGVATVNASTGLVTPIAPGTATITYNVNNPCGALATAVVTINPTPTGVTGPANICTTLVTPFSSGPSGGTWTSSSNGLATVDASGNVTGVAVGTPNISYTLPGGCFATVPVVVNLQPAPIAGSGSVCTSQTTPLSDATAGGVWSSNFAPVASVSPTGVVSGLVAGSATISYTLPTGGCSSTALFIVNPLPTLISGTFNVCAGLTTSLADAGGGTWSSSNLGVATVIGSLGIVSGVSAGTTNITYTLPGGCYRFTPVTINPTPAAILGVTSLCQGATTSLSSSTPGGVWISSSPSLATIDPFGTVSGVAGGTTTISYMFATGCMATAPVQVNALPTPYLLTGGGGYCAGSNGAHIGLSYSTTGVTYTLHNGTTIEGTGFGSNSGLDFGAKTDVGTYTATALDGTTGCANTMAGSVAIFINPLPGVHTVSGGGNYCMGGSGAPVVMDGSDAGINYQLFNGLSPVGAAISGTGTSLNFGMQTVAGTYKVVAMDALTGCTKNMSGSATIVINPPPTMYTLAGGGNFCFGGTGKDITLNGSDIGTNYQLYNGGGAIGPMVNGTGSSLDFGLNTNPGSYSVVATTTATTCTGDMAGSPVITINPLPSVYGVTGGGGICPGSGGVHVGLSFSDPGLSYQLYNGGPAGLAVGGAGSSIDFGLQSTTGSYTVVATNTITNCTSNMSGVAVVTTGSLPTPFVVTGGGAYCPGGTGTHIMLGGSAGSATYQLFLGTSPAGSPVSGTGGALDFGLHTVTGTYSVAATNTVSGCTSTMPGSATISLNALPAPFVLTGTGTSFCQGDPGIDLVLSGSEAGATYQLYRGTTVVGGHMSGSGSTIDFGNQTIAGVYTVVATNGSGCNGNMTGDVPVSINPLPTTYTITGGGNYCVGGSGVRVGLSGSAPGTSYQLQGTSGPVGPVVAGTGIALDFGFQTNSGTYSVVATNDATLCSKPMAGIAVVTLNDAPDVHDVTGGGNYCAGTPGSDIQLNGSNTGIKYQLYNGPTSVGTAIMGTGTPLDLGIHGAGSYTVVAINTTTGCNGNMSGAATIAANPAPTSYTVTGGGNYCAGSDGKDVSLSNSDAGINYQLMYLGSSLGTAMPGTGATVDFGTQTLAGGYTIVATDTTTLCSSTMTGSATIIVSTPPVVYSVTGGGSLCAGGTGINVGLSSSGTGVTYQLYNGVTSVGGMVSGIGGGLDFGPQTNAGSYTVIANPGGVCATPMSGTSNVVVNPLPGLYSVTGGGNICMTGVGLHVGLSGSATGINYQLYNSGSPVGSAVAGTTAALDFGVLTTAGSYSVMATDGTTGCTNTMTGSGSVSISVASLPHAFNVAGGGNYCTGGAGVPVTLSSSNTNVNYQLYHSGTISGSPLPGTGTRLDFGSQTAAGNYTVMGADAGTGCTNNMTDTAIVTIEPMPIAHITASKNSIAVGQADTFTATATNAGTSATYQWVVNGYPVPGATMNPFITANLANHDSVSCEITSSSACNVTANSNTIGINVTANTTIAGTVTSSGSDVILVPNPNKGAFTLRGKLGTTNDEEVNVEITDMVGHVVYNSKVMTHSGNINEKIQMDNTVANGMYILSIHSAAENQVFHFVMEQ